MAGAAAPVKSYSLWVMPRGDRAAAEALRVQWRHGCLRRRLCCLPHRCRQPPPRLPLRPHTFLPFLRSAGPLYDKLHAEVRRLAAAVPGAPTFLPHVTLLGGVRTSEADVLERARTLAGQLKVVPSNEGSTDSASACRFAW